ncbi:MAG: hypothetical protein IPP61_01120 [Cytophagaceae bacterium]|nr:hypothetical protein [Cytophagaceae bacterium]MBL0300969.1 hypothetical protein [Cytophagaceae bacterium]MBL0323779.1 hypothetical protein [Cytophagaceae bacterium]
MKKLMLCMFASFFIIASAMAQSKEKAYYRKEIARLDKQEAMLNKQKLENKKALRKLLGSEVSQRSKDQFAADFGQTTDVQWEIAPRMDEGTFTKDGVVTTAYYNTDNKLIGTTCVKSFMDLPMKAQNEINDNYKSYTVGDVIMFDGMDNVSSYVTLYNQDFTNSDNYFVELRKDNKKLVMEVNMAGDVAFFTRLR